MKHIILASLILTSCGMDEKEETKVETPVTTEKERYIPREPEVIKKPREVIERDYYKDGNYTFVTDSLIMECEDNAEIYLGVTIFSLNMELNSSFTVLRAGFEDNLYIGSFDDTDESFILNYSRVSSNNILVERELSGYFTSKGVPDGLFKQKMTWESDGYTCYGETNFNGNVF